LLGQVFLVGWHLVDFQNGVVLVVEVEQVWCDSNAHGVTFAAIAVDFNLHDTLLAADGPAGTADLDPKTRTCYNEDDKPSPEADVPDQ
jgi:hypothetical protein